MQLYGGQIRSSIQRILDVGRQRIRSPSISSDVDDVFVHQDVGQLNGGDEDEGSRWSLMSDQPSETSADSSSQYDARSDLSRLSSSRSDVRLSSTKLEATRDRRRKVDRGSSLRNDTFTNKYRPKRQVRHFLGVASTKRTPLLRSAR